jgi:hypothetical protein
LAVNFQGGDGIYLSFKSKKINMKYSLLFIFTMLFCSSFLTAQSGDNLFTNDAVHEIRITFEEPEFWTILTNNYQIGQTGGSGSTIEYLMGSVEIDGETVDSIGIRQKGFSSYFSSNEFKKSLKLDFNEFVPGKRYDGLRKVNLNNGVGDPALQRDFLCFDMIREAGGIAPRVAYAKVYLNDEYWGVYVMIEQVDRAFLDNNFANGKGNLFKNVSWSELEYLGTNVDLYKEIFELKTNEDIDDWDRFIEFMDLLNNGSVSEFETEIQDYFNVDLYLRTLAVDVMSDNWDSYIEHGRNWYMYQDSSTNAFHWIPWDYNLTMGGDFSSGEGPNPPFDTLCPFEVDFLFGFDSLTVSFTDETDSLGTAWLWTFGDDSTSTAQNPIHNFSAADLFEVCLTVSIPFGDSLCEKTICKTVDLFLDPNDCLTVQNGSSPYNASDPIFLQVIAQDAFCCENDWDGFCQQQYDAIESGNTGGGPGPGGGGPQIMNFPLMMNGTNKILISKLLNVPHFRERYLNIACEMLENNFTLDRLSPIIDYNTDLVQAAVYEDPNYIFGASYFGYDANNELGDELVSIPPLKFFIAERIGNLENDLAATGHDCDLQFAQIAWHDLVINEFMASNAENGGIADPAGSYADWIEIYNNTDEVVDLGSLFLSDNPDSLTKWKFDLGTFLDPDDYLIVWADKDLEEEGIHADFKLSKSGEQLYLLHEDGTFIDSLSYGEQETNIASARIPNGTGNFVMQDQTFNGHNETPNATIAQELDGDIRIFPNPAEGVFFVDLSRVEVFGEKMMVLRNYLGQLVKIVENAGTDLVTVQMENVGTGFFTVEIVFEDGSSVVRKILVK